MTNDQKKPKGFIAIVSMLIIAGVALFFSMRMLLDGVENANLSLSSIYYEKARFNANACLQDTLLRLTQENQFSRNLNYHFSSSDTCTTALTWGGSQSLTNGQLQRTVTLVVTGTSSTFQRKFQYGLRVTRQTINHVSGPVTYINNVHVDSLTELTT